MKFRPWCFFWQGKPKLLHRHAEPAGEILDLCHDARGRLCVRARVTHPEARRCPAFSVGATIEKWELRNADNSHFYGLVTQAIVDEISLTDRPCNPHAVVQLRYRAPTTPSFHELMQQKVRCLTELVGILRTMSAPPLRNAARPQSDFANLVEAINSGVQL
jgi:hypothetical protein